VSVGSYLDAWLAHVSGRVRARTWQGYECLIRLYARPNLGHVAPCRASPTSPPAALRGAAVRTGPPALGHSATERAVGLHQLLARGRGLLAVAGTYGTSRIVPTAVPPWSAGPSRDRCGTTAGHISSGSAPDCPEKPADLRFPSWGGRTRTCDRRIMSPSPTVPHIPGCTVTCGFVPAEEGRTCHLRERFAPDSPQQWLTGATLLIWARARTPCGGSDSGCPTSRRGPTRPAPGDRTARPACRSRGSRRWRCPRCDRPDGWRP
jgi:hypothetical protein